MREDGFSRFGMISYKDALRYLMEEFDFSESKAKRYLVASRDHGVWRIPVGFNRIYLNREAFMAYAGIVRRSIEQAEEVESRR